MGRTAAPFLLGARLAPSLESFRRTSNVGLMIPIACRVDSLRRGTPVTFFWRARFASRCLFARGRILCLAASFEHAVLPLAIDIHKCDNSAVDFVFSCAIRTYPQRIRTPLCIGHSALTRAERFDHLAQHLFQIGNINVMPKLG